MLILMASATYAQCSQIKDVDMLVTVSKLKNSGFVDVHSLEYKNIYTMG